ncbi:hypothetical protein [Nocardia rhizosphaerae]|uniref:TAP-like protein n=1 Tax=Nocardia rhizosphaerae TaxID=1691571 RepID=A0ABV8L615_9NOCA
MGYRSAACRGCGAPSILAGLRETHPEAEVDSYLTPLGRELVDAIGTECIDDTVGNVKGLAMGDMFSGPPAEGPLRAALTSYMALPTSGYDAPILLLLNAADVVVPSPLHAALVGQFGWCRVRDGHRARAAHCAESADVGRARRLRRQGARRSTTALTSPDRRGW